MKKCSLILVVLIGLVTGVNAQMSSAAAVGTKAFEILQGLSNTSQQQFSNYFLPAKQIMEKRGADTAELNDYYPKLYNELLKRGISWSKIEFVSFKAGVLDKDNTSKSGILVFSYLNTEYYVKLSYFFYNSKYYLVTILRLAVYPYQD